MRGPNPDHICGFCEGFTLQGVDPADVERGRGQCTERECAASWEDKCVLFKVAREGVAARRRFVAKQQPEAA